MHKLSEKHFGLLIAYILPGFVAISGISHFSPVVSQWMAVPPASPTIGGFMYVTLSSLGVGLTISALRWLMVDSLHRWTGVVAPKWDFACLQENLEAFDAIVVSHYRYYQFYANLVIAFPIWAAGWLTRHHGAIALVAGCVVLEAVLFFASRDALSKYYRRGEQLLSRDSRRIIMS